MPSVFFAGPTESDGGEPGGVGSVWICVELCNQGMKAQ
jgi:hypothetical protein